jgi:hypothetical protein
LARERVTQSSRCWFLFAAEGSDAISSWRACGRFLRCFFIADHLQKMTALERKKGWLAGGFVNAECWSGAT